MIPASARRLALLAAAAMVLSACGGAPSRDDFISKTKDTLGADLVPALKDRGVPAAKANAMIDDFVACMYDALKRDVDLLQKAYDDPTDPLIAPELDSITLDCVNALNTEMAQEVDPLPTTLPLPTIVPETTLVAGDDGRPRDDRPVTLLVPTPADLSAHVGEALGPTDWVIVDQSRIDGFADATGDAGYLPLALANLFLPQLLTVETFSMGINVGLDKVRFPSPVLAGARIRARGEVLSASPAGEGAQVVVRVTIEVDGAAEPACVADTVSRFLP